MPKDVRKEVAKIITEIYFHDPEDHKKIYSANALRTCVKKCLGISINLMETRLQHTQRGRIDNYMGVITQDGWAEFNEIANTYTLNKDKIREYRGEHE